MSLKEPDFPSTLPEDLSTASEHQKTVKREETLAYQKTVGHQETGEHQAITGNQESVAQLGPATERKQDRIDSRFMGPLIVLVAGYVLAWGIFGSFYCTTLAVSISITWLYLEVTTYRVWRGGLWTPGLSLFVNIRRRVPFIVCCLWLICLSPLHVLFSPLDLLIKQQDQLTVRFQTLYDPGESATLE
jgi:hypothetical protein